MRVVLDTNVLISGIFFRGRPAKILKIWRDNKDRLGHIASNLKRVS